MIRRQCLEQRLKDHAYDQVAAAGASYQQNIRIGFEIGSQGLSDPGTLNREDWMQGDKFFQNSRGAIVGRVCTHCFGQSPSGTEDIALPVQADSQISIAACARPINLDRSTTMLFTLLETGKGIETVTDVILQHISDLAFFWR